MAGGWQLAALCPFLLAVAEKNIFEQLTFHNEMHHHADRVCVCVCAQRTPRRGAETNGWGLIMRDDVCHCMPLQSVTFGSIDDLILDKRQHIDHFNWR